MHALVHVYMPWYMCTCLGTCVHALVHVYMRWFMCMHALVHVYMRWFMCTCVGSCVPLHIRSGTYFPLAYNNTTNHENMKFISKFLQKFFDKLLQDQVLQSPIEKTYNFHDQK